PRQKPPIESQKREGMAQTRFSPRTSRRAGTRRCWLWAAGVLLAAIPAAHAQVTTSDLADYRAWGLTTAAQIDDDLRRTNSQLYAERANLFGQHLGGINGYAFVWPTATQFRVRNSVYEAAPVNVNRQRLLAMSDELQQAYWHQSADQQNGYVVAPGSTERYYDDNAHLVVALAEAYELTGEQRLLDRAIATHAFVLEGEDNFQDGGIYFREGSFGNNNTISTLQEARGAAMLYQATGQQPFLDDATRLLEWTNSHVQRSDGLYYQEYRSTGIDDISNVPLANGAGMGILANLEMYEITLDEAYLEEAQRVGARSSQHFAAADNGRIFSAGYWGFELVDAWVDLYHYDRDPRWLDDASRAIEFLNSSVADGNGRYGQDWNVASTGILSEWDLNNQAPVARAYLDTGLADTPAEPGDFNLDGLINAADWTIFAANSHADFSGLLASERFLRGDLDRDGDSDFRDFRTFKNIYIAVNGESAFASLLAAPEPAAGLLLCVIVCGTTAGHRWRTEI
ncbi:MAG: hypothetical protein KDA37_18305, partial [Planctomycetales bacterium]|nr:hypothetical protein [Planctomycetales bacterium]